MSILPSAAVQRMFPSKITALEELAAYAEGREPTAAAAALTVPPAGFVLSTVAVEGEGAAGGGGGGGVKRSAPVVPGARKGAPTTSRGFSGMAPAASGATVVKSTLKKAEEEEGGARVQIDHVVVMGTGPDDACNAFEANPFKPESALRLAPRPLRSTPGGAPSRGPSLALSLPPLSPSPPCPLSVCKRCRKMKIKHVA
jgi:hypothetical protein